MTNPISMADMRFGNFIPPIHVRPENPTLLLDRDMQVIQHLDTLGYDESWIGEHHSGGGELISSPELIIAVMAERTKSIKLGTGVNSLPYHHPLILADRWMQLHHMTRGRAMFGSGPGSLPSDAKAMGIPVAKQRDRMEEALACVAKLMRGETVSYKCEWFELVEASLQLRPYRNIPVEMTTACVVSPSGPMAAGRNGTAMMTLSATAPAALKAASANWQVACDIAEANGHVMDRRGWRMVGLCHIAETKDQAMKDIEYGMMDWINYFSTIGTLPMVPEEGKDDPIGYMIENGLAVIGTPDEAVKQIERIWEASGGFGCYLIADTNWAPFDAKLKSYDLFARYAMPEIKGMNKGRDISHDRIVSQHAQFVADQRKAMDAQFAKLEKVKADIANQPK
ncbi:LLM class flavin-dependent oxidoreductase [Novosphingobium sp.]|uniref:LLM class flavin-dependent oxidoreductase n=1 Tax=Novosphingobium sp. TaxID=1874826 RepID=UPI00352AF9C9